MAAGSNLIATSSPVYVFDPIFELIIAKDDNGLKLPKWVNLVVYLYTFINFSKCPTAHFLDDFVTISNSHINPIAQHYTLT